MGPDTTAIRAALRRLRYLDFLEGWRLANQRAAKALVDWRAASRGAKAAAYAAYLAALDEEAQAAECLKLAAA